MQDENQLEKLQDAGRVMLALWQNPEEFDASEIAVLGVIQTRLWEAGTNRVQVSRVELMREAEISRATATKAVRRLIEKAVIQRHDMGHKKPFAYSVDVEALERLAA